MEADWSAEIGSGLPSITVPWRDADSGLKFVDLRAHPEAISELPEALRFPAVGAALSLLNSSRSQVFTSKCDVWRVAGAELDAMNLEAATAETRFAVIAYIDVLLQAAVDFASFELHENWLRRMSRELGALVIPLAQVDLTLRWAHVEENEGFATTIHITGCGTDEPSTMRTWEAALSAVVELVARGPGTPGLPPQHSDK